MCCLQESPKFSILADECQVISAQEELSICDRWLVNGKPDEHFMSVLQMPVLSHKLYNPSSVEAT